MKKACFSAKEGSQPRQKIWSLILMVKGIAPKSMSEQTTSSRDFLEEGQANHLISESFHPTVVADHNSECYTGTGYEWAYWSYW